MCPLSIRTFTLLFISSFYFLNRFLFFTYCFFIHPFSFTLSISPPYPCRFPLSSLFLFPFCLLVLFFFQYFYHRIGRKLLISTSASLGNKFALYSWSLVFLILRMKSFIMLSKLVCSVLFHFSIFSCTAEAYRTVFFIPISSSSCLNFWLLAILFVMFSLARWYNLHYVIMCFLLSIVSLQQWHYSDSLSFNKCLILNVSLDPSHPVLSLQIYLISTLLCLFKTMYG